MWDFHGNVIIVVGINGLKSSFCAILSHFFCVNNLPQCWWVAVDLYLTTLWLG